ncbi:MAG: PQQ-binding-like beta-propeller repeat protein [Planctomycetaceae bacterium]
MMFFLAVSLFSVTVVISQDAVEPAAPTASPVEFSPSVSWPKQRQLEQQLAALLALDREQQYQAGFNILRQLQEVDPQTIVSAGSRVLPVHRVLQQWTASLTGEARTAYLQTFDELARHEWERVSSSSFAQKLHVALRFPETRTGAVAAERLSAELTDRGEYAEGLAWCRMVREHRLSGAEERQSAWLRQVVCHLKLGDDDAAAGLWREYQMFVMSQNARTTTQAELLSKWIETRLAEGRLAKAISPAALPERISREPIWQQRATFLADIQDLLKDALTDYREQGWLDLPVARPLILGERIVVPQLNRLVCYRAENGEVLWQSPTETTLFEPNEESAKFLQNTGFRQMLAQTLVQQVERDAITGAMSTDGKLIYAIREWPSELMSDSNTNGAKGNGPESRFSRNRLIAYDLATGQPRWELRHLSPERIASLEISLARDPQEETPSEPAAPGENQKPVDSELPGVLFLGAPVDVGRDIYVIAQVGSELLLLSLDPERGEVEQAYRLATMSADESNQPSRRGVSALLVHRDGVLYGATGRGLIFAFELHRRGLSWGITTRRDDWDRSDEIAAARFQRKADDEWWNGWRDTFTGVADRMLIVAAPDMDWVRALDRESGRVLWEHPRGEGLFVSELLHDRLLIIEPTHVRAISLKTGEMLWKTPIGRPAGRGCVLAQHYLLPLRDKLWMRLSLADGTPEIVERYVPASMGGNSTEPSNAGSVFIANGGLISLNHDQVTMYADWKMSFDKVQTLRETDKENLQLLDRLGRLEFESGRYETAAEYRRGYVEKQTDPMLALAARREFLKERLTELTMFSDRLPQLRDELLALEQATMSAPLAQLAIAEAERRRGDLSAGLTSLLKIAEQSFPEREYDDILSGRKIRWDRYLQGLILDLIGTAEGETARALEELMSDAAERARSSPDAFAQARFADRFSHLSYGRELRLKSAQEWGVGARLHHVDLALRELLQSGDASVASQALVALAEVLWEKSFRSDAVACYRQLQREYAGHLLKDGQTIPQFLSNLKLPERYSAELQSGPPLLWPKVAPQVSHVDEVYAASVDWVLIPVESDRYSLWNRMTIGVDRRGRTVKFHLPDEPQAWELKLPPSTSMFRFVFPMHRGWGIGRLLILQVGADLLAISPWNERGEPQAEIVWYLEGFPRKQPQLNDLGIRRAPVKVGVAEPLLDVLDQYGRVIGDFGAIGPGQFYLFRHGQLEARETATAALVWQRELIKPFTKSQSDAEHLFLYRPHIRELEILRVVDGKTVAVRSAPCDPDDFLITQGRHVLIAEKQADGQMQFGWFDLFADRYEWRHVAPAGTMPFSTDQETFGLLTSEGQLRLLRRANGEQIAETKVTLPPQVTNIHCIPTERLLVIALTGPLKDPARLAATELRIDHRRPLVNGRLLALDRQTGALQWEREMTDTALPLEQPHGVPLLVLNYWENRPAGAEQPQVVGVLKCLDLTTGQDLVQVEGDSWGDHYAFSVHTEQRRVELHSPNKTIRLNYPLEVSTP